MTDAYAREHFKHVFCFSIKHQADKTECDIFREKVTRIFETFSGIEEFKVCHIIDKLSSEAYDESMAHKEYKFDIAFNSAPGRLIPFFERLLLPLICLLVKFKIRVCYGSGIHFYTIEYFDKDTNTTTVDDQTVNSLESARTSKMGVFTDKIYYSDVLEFIKVVRPDAVRQRDKYRAFYLFLLFSIFKTEWKRQFAKLKSDGNMKVFNVELMIYSFKDKKWYNDCWFAVHAPDAVTMAFKLLLFAAFTKIQSNTPIMQYHLETNDYGKKVIPMSDQFFKKWYEMNKIDYHMRYKYLLELTDGTPYYDIVNWMYCHASTPYNCESGDMIIDVLNKLAEMPDKFRI